MVGERSEVLNVSSTVFTYLSLIGYAFRFLSCLFHPDWPYLRTKITLQDGS